MIDVAHDGHDRRAGLQVLVDVRQAPSRPSSTSASLTRFTGCRTRTPPARPCRVQALVDRGQDAVLHQHLDHLGTADRHAGGEVLDGDGLGQDDLADDELGRPEAAALALALAAQGREAGTAALDQLRVAAQHQAVEPLGHDRRIAVSPAGCRPSPPCRHAPCGDRPHSPRAAAGQRTTDAVGSAISAPGRGQRSSVVAAGAAPPRVSRSFCRRSSSASSLEASSSALRRASSSCRRRASSSALRLAAASSSARRRAASSVARREFSTSPGSAPPPRPCGPNPRHAGGPPSPPRSAA